MPNPNVRSRKQIVVDPVTDALQIFNSEGQVIAWIDSTGTGQGNLSGSLSAINNQTASYQLVSSDANSYVRMNVGSANTVTVPPDATISFVTGTVVTVRQIGAGQTTITAGSGVTITSPSTLSLRVQNSTVQLIKVSSNTWDLIGDVA